MRKAPPNAASIPNGKKTAPLGRHKEIGWIKRVPMETICVAGA